MKIAVFGAGGRIGSRIVEEALNRGHYVTAVVRRPEDYTFMHPHLKVAKGDIFDAQHVETGAFNQDAVVSAYNNTKGAPASTITEVIVPLVKGLKQAYVKRLLVVGGAGCLDLTPGVQLVDTPDFPPAYKPAALAQREALKALKNEKELDWTYFSPAADINPGGRTGKFRIGTTQLIMNEEGHSLISMEDYAVAMIDEIENPQHVRQQMTIGY